eukprot:529593_1
MSGLSDVLAKFSSPSASATSTTEGAKKQGAATDAPPDSPPRPLKANKKDVPKHAVTTSGSGAASVPSKGSPSGPVISTTEVAKKGVVKNQGAATAAPPGSSSPPANTIKDVNKPA